MTMSETMRGSAANRQKQGVKCQNYKDGISMT